ncbi:MAG: hypothetical protein ACI85H_000591 [Paracoccaceae bacterium]|jgi:hypothetical protein
MKMSNNGAPENQKYSSYVCQALSYVCEIRGNLGGQS